RQEVLLLLSSDKQGSKISSPVSRSWVVSYIAASARDALIQIKTVSVAEPSGHNFDYRITIAPRLSARLHFTFPESHPRPKWAAKHWRSVDQDQCVAGHDILGRIIGMVLIGAYAAPSFRLFQ